MNTALKSTIDWFIPDHIKTDQEVYRNGRVFVITFLLVTLACFVYASYSLIASAEMASDFPFKSGLIYSIFVLLIYRVTGNHNLSTNLGVGFFAFLFFSMCMQTGGLYSDDYLWCVIIPLTAFLVSNVRYGLMWTVVLVCFGFYLYYLESHASESFRLATLSKTKEYYLIGSFGLFLLCGGIVAVFRRQSEKYVVHLKHQRKQLRLQKAMIEEQSEELIKAKEDLIQSNKELEQFAYATSHDLKEPLRTTNGFINLLQSELASSKELDLDTCLKYLNMTSSCLSNMNQLIIDLLEYARLKANDESDFKVMSLNTVLDNVLHNLHEQIESSNAIINRTENLPELSVIPVKINQLFQNIISNSIKFKKKDIPIIINIGFIDRGSKVEFFISDNGIGISKEQHKRIFEPFTRLNYREEYTGSGIGLATCKRIIDLHQGEIWVESEIGIGTTFHFTIEKENESGGSKQNESIELKRTG